MVSLRLRFVVTYQTGDVWLALADGTRRAIVERLAHGPSAVGELARDLPVSRPAVSQHLKVLKSAGLVVVEVDGARRLYGIDPKGIDALKEWLDGFWDTTLEAFKRAAEREQTRLES